MAGLYRKLIVWQKSMLLVEEIYRVIELFPDRERFGLANQMRRAAVSIPSNIAEGQYRFKPSQNRQYLRVAYGSCAELDTQISIAKNLKYISDIDIRTGENLLDEIMRMLNTLLHKS